MKEESPFRSMASRWPSSVISRSEIPKFTGGLLTVKYMSNMDSSGVGPPRIRCGKKVAYPLDELITWLEARSSAVPKPGGDPTPGRLPRHRRAG